MRPLIENLQRRKEWNRAVERQNQALHGVKPHKSGVAGLEFEEVQFLEADATREFLDEAELGREEMVLLEEHLRRPLTVGGKESLVLLLAHTYAQAIKRSTGHCADLLTQVWLARNRRTRLSERVRISICSEAIRFADGLNTPGFHGSWAGNTQAPTYPPGTAPFEQREETLFAERMKLYRSDWFREADRTITVRFLLAGGRIRPVRTNPFRRRVAALMVSVDDATDRVICVEMDRQNERALTEKRELPFPVPKSLERNSIRLWAMPFLENKTDLIQDIHELLSKIRNEFGLRKNDPRANRPRFSETQT